MIPIPCKDDMERLGRGIELKFHEIEELTEEQVKRILEHYKNLKDFKDTFNESVTGGHTGVL